MTAPAKAMDVRMTIDPLRFDGVLKVTIDPDKSNSSSHSSITVQGPVLAWGFPEVPLIAPVLESAAKVPPKTRGGAGSSGWGRWVPVFE